MIVLPIGDENPRARFPFVHYFIITANVLAFLYLVLLPENAQESLILTYGLVPAHFQPYQLFTSLFLHAGFAHIFGNLLFLWIVGDNVEDRLGHLGYLLFYLAVGVTGGLVYLFLASGDALSEPCIGASGAISGVMAAYLVFFPNARIRIFYFFWFLFNVVYVSAKWAIGLWFGQQILLYFLTGSTTGVAFDAHVGGFIAGLVVALLLRPFLRPYDPVSRILSDRASDEDWTTSRHPSPDHLGWPRPDQSAPEHIGWPRSGQSSSDRLGWPATAEPIDVEPIAAKPVEPPTATAVGSLADLEHALALAVAAGRQDDAFRYYERLANSSDAPIDADVLLKLAHLLVDRSDYDRALPVYENYLRHYPNHREALEAAFRVGMIYSRTKGNYARARSYLQTVADKHPNPTRRARALDEIRRLDSLTRLSPYEMR